MIESFVQQEARFRSRDVIESVKRRSIWEKGRRRVLRDTAGRPFLAPSFAPLKLRHIDPTEGAREARTCRSETVVNGLPILTAILAWRRQSASSDIRP